MEDIIGRIIEKISLDKIEIMNEIQDMGYKGIEKRVLLFKRYQSLNLFQEMFLIAANNRYGSKKQEIYNTFIQVSESFIESCRVHLPIKQSSWTIHLETFEIIKEIILKA